MDGMVGSLFSKVTSNNEDTITDLLCFLMKHKFMRDALLSSIGIDQRYLDEITPEMIHIRKALKDGTIPDITIGTSSYRPSVIIENKIEAPLGESQVTAYPEAVSLSDSPYKKVIYLVPRNYEETEERIKRARDGYGSLVIVKPWENLLEDIDRLELANVNALVMEIVGYIKDKIAPHKVKHVTLDAGEAVMLYEVESFHRAVRLLRDLQPIFFGAMEILWEKVQLKNSPDVFHASDNNWIEGDVDSTVLGKFWRYQSATAMNVFVGFDFNLDFKDSNNARFYPAVRIEKQLVQEQKIRSVFKREEYLLCNDHYYFTLSKYSLLSEADKVSFAKEVAAVLFKVLGVQSF